MNQQQDNNYTKKEITRSREIQAACFFAILGTGFLFVESWMIIKKEQ